MTDHLDHDLIELDAVSTATRSGPYGVDEYRAGLFIVDAGLVAD